MSMQLISFDNLRLQLDLNHRLLVWLSSGWKSVAGLEVIIHPEQQIHPNSLDVILSQGREPVETSFSDTLSSVSFLSECFGQVSHFSLLALAGHFK